MSKFDIKDKLDKMLYDTYNFVYDCIFYFNFKAKKHLNKNSNYKNIHAGERCFILGTGPSLKNVTTEQIEVLKNEIVFGTNSLYKVDIVSSLTPKYYALLDNLYWEQWSHTFEEVVEKYKNKPPIFITDLRAKKIADKANSAEQHIIIHSKKYPTKKMSDDLSINIFAAMNVVSNAILTASYMGFKKIYLMGCDYNAFCNSGRGHAYNDASELSQAKYNLAFYLRFYWITTEFHYLIEKLAKEKGVEIINLTEGSLLDAYRKQNFDEVIMLKS